MRLRPADEDQFAGDLGARAERADADIGARQLLGDDAHGDLAHAGAAEFFRDGQAEDAEIGEAGDDVERDILVLGVPLLREGRHIVRREFTHFRADRLERVVEPGRADGFRRLVMVDQLREAGAVGRRIAFEHEPGHGVATPRGDLFAGQAEVGKPDDLALAHRNAAEHLRQKLGEADPGQKLLGLAIGALGRQALGVMDEFAKALLIGGEPGEAMSRVLIGLDQLGRQLVVLAHPSPHGGQRLAVKRLDGFKRRMGVGEPVGGVGVRRCGHDGRS